MSAWDNPAEMLSRAQAARQQGDRDLAYQMYARASELNPQDPHAWQGRAETATNSDEALVSYAYASALDPDDQPLARTLDATIALRVSNNEKTDVGLLLAIGQELAEVGFTERAAYFFKRAAELDRSSTDALVWLAGVETDKEKQAEYLNRALATNPRDPRPRAALLALKPPTPPPPLRLFPPARRLQNALPPRTKKPPPAEPTQWRIPQTNLRLRIQKRQHRKNQKKNCQLLRRCLRVLLQNSRPQRQCQ